MAVGGVQILTAGPCAATTYRTAGYPSSHMKVSHGSSCQVPAPSTPLTGVRMSVAPGTLSPPSVMRFASAPPGALSADLNVQVRPAPLVASPCVHSPQHPMLDHSVISSPAAGGLHTPQRSPTPRQSIMLSGAGALQGIAMGGGTRILTPTTPLVTYRGGDEAGTPMVVRRSVVVQRFPSADLPSVGSQKEEVFMKTAADLREEAEDEKDSSAAEMEEEAAEAGPATGAESVSLTDAGDNKPRVSTEVPLPSTPSTRHCTEVAEGDVDTLVLDGNSPGAVGNSDSAAAEQPPIADVDVSGAAGPEDPVEEAPAAPARPESTRTTAASERRSPRASPQAPTSPATESRPGGDSQPSRQRPATGAPTGSQSSRQAAPKSTARPVSPPKAAVPKLKSPRADPAAGTTPAAQPSPRKTSKEGVTSSRTATSAAPARLTSPRNPSKEKMTSPKGTASAGQSPAQVSPRNPSKEKLTSPRGTTPAGQSPAQASPRKSSKEVLTSPRGNSKPATNTASRSSDSSQRKVSKEGTVASPRKGVAEVSPAAAKSKAKASPKAAQATQPSASVPKLARESSKESNGKAAEKRPSPLKDAAAKRAANAMPTKSPKVVHTKSSGEVEAAKKDHEVTEASRPAARKRLETPGAADARQQDRQLILEEKQPDRPVSPRPSPPGSPVPGSPVPGSPLPGSPQHSPPMSPRCTGRSAMGRAESEVWEDNTVDERQMKIALKLAKRLNTMKQRGGRR